MKKLTILVMFLGWIILLVGCSTQTTDDVYDKDNETQEQLQVEPSEELTEDGMEDDDESNDETSDESEMPDQVTTDAEPEEPIEEAPDSETPAEDIYPAASEPIDFDFSEFEGIEPLEVNDDELSAELQDYLYHFYFNYYFVHGLEEETGNVGVDAMTLFALSYIMQYEYNELEFDAETFTLYIPEEYVVQKVEKVFLRNLDMFRAYEELGIGYENEVYSVNVEDGVWDVELVMSKVEQLGDFTYRVTADIISENSGRVKEQVEAIIDESLDGHVLVNYNLVTVEE